MLHPAASALTTALGRRLVIRNDETLSTRPTGELDVTGESLPVEALAAEVQSDVQHCRGLPSSRRGRAEFPSAGGPPSSASVGTSRRSRLRLVDPHFQPATRPACSIHLCISGPCASSRVFTLT